MTIRVIARLDWKPPHIIKPVFFDGLRKIGIASEIAKDYMLQGVDEVSLLGITATLFRTKLPQDELRAIKSNINIPLSVGGWITNAEEAIEIIRNGADKVVLNTAAIMNKSIIKNISNEIGSQSVAIHIQAKKIQGEFYAFTECGRFNSNKLVADWIKELNISGAGEILLSSIDCDGVSRGPDDDLIKMALALSSIPVVAGSGFAELEDFHAFKDSKLSGVMVGNSFHQKQLIPSEVKRFLNSGT